MYLKSLRSSIEKLTKWESSGEAFGYIDSVSDKNPDYIYEFFCAMKLLHDLKKNHDIELTPGKKGFKFPQKPGNKANWAKFLIKDRLTKKTLLQFCLGVKVTLRLSLDTPFGADISFQTSDAPDAPDDSHIVLIMDAKYKESKKATLDIGIIKEFAMNVADMSVPKVEKNNLVFDGLTDLNDNCLFTNGEAIAKHEQYCRNHNLKQVGRFDCDGRTMEIVG